MKMRYRFEITGSAAQGQTWFVKGEVETEKRGQFMDLPHKAMSEAFRSLTNGQAVYGRPGIGCDGPYAVTRLLIEEKEDANAR